MANAQDVQQPASLTLSAPPDHRSMGDAPDASTTCCQPVNCVRKPDTRESESWPVRRKKRPKSIGSSLRGWVPATCHSGYSRNAESFKVEAKHKPNLFKAPRPEGPVVKELRFLVRVGLRK